MNDHLLKWLNGKQNYIVGTVLYGQFGNDESVKQLLATGKSPHTEQVLLNQINRLINGDAVEAEPVSIDQYGAMPDDSDRVLQSCKNKWIPLYTEMNYKRHALDKLLDDAGDESSVQRGKLAREILELERQCIAIWKQRDHYQRTGIVPGKSIDAEPVIDEFKAAQNINLFKIYVRRYKNALKKNPGDISAAQLLKKYSDQLTQLQRLHG